MVSQFLECSVPALVNRNVSNSKEYGATYEQVKQQLRLPLDFLSAQYSTKMMQHFYSDRERHDLMQRWSEEAEIGTLSGAK